MKERVTPNFFIIGAIKSGTSTLTNYLIRHPEVYMPGTWELNYLADDIIWTSSPVVDNDDDYFSFFHKGAEKKCIGEKSVSYLFSRRAAKRIHEINPHARLICILRNPVKLLWSLYKYNIANFEEDILKFEQALAAEEDRKAGRRIPETGTIVQNLFYREIIQFDRQLQTYFDLFPRKQIKIYLFDELKSAPEALYRDVLHFLELDYHPLPQKKKYNEGGRIEVHQARLFLHQRPQLKKIWNQFPAPLRQGLKKVMVNIQGQEPAQLNRISPILEKKLYKEANPMINRLAKMIGKDLSAWQISPRS